MFALSKKLSKKPPVQAKTPKITLLLVNPLIRLPKKSKISEIITVIFIAGLVVFVISPALEKGSWIHAVFLGALFGFITYATYDLTNLATLRNWPIAVVFVDIAWGTVLCTLVGGGSYLIGSWLK